MNRPTIQEVNNEKSSVRLSEKMRRQDFKAINETQEFLKEIPDNIFDQEKVEESQNALPDG